MSFQLPPLPYPKDALMPHISRDTLTYHYEKHHRTYMEKLNAALDSIDYAGGDLLEVVLQAHERGDQNIFNNAAQAWNHTFFWNSMSPAPTSVEDGELGRAIQAFGGMDKLREAFIEAGAGQFGSGWVWIVQDPDGALDVVSTANAEPPQIHALKPLLACDVWEHAYYLDYQNDRVGFLETFFDALANWPWASKRLRLEGEGSVSAGRRFREAQQAFAERGPVKEKSAKALAELDS